MVTYSHVLTHTANVAPPINSRKGAVSIAIFPIISLNEMVVDSPDVLGEYAASIHVSFYINIYIYIYMFLSYIYIL